MTEQPDGLRIVIPARRQWWLLLFLPIWLVIWALGGVMAVRQLVRELAQGSGASLFLAVWLVFWAVALGLAGYVLLWNLAGREEIVLSSSALRVRREALGLGRTNEFDLAHVRDLRASPAMWNPWDWASGLQVWGIGGGTIAFDYGAKTYRFGGLDEAEAKQLVHLIKERYHW